MELVRDAKMFGCLPQFSMPVVTEEFEAERNCLKHGMVNVHVIKYDDESEQWHCKLCQKEEEERIAENAKRVSEENHIEWCKKHNIEPEFYYKTLDDYIPKTPGQQKAKEAVEKMIAEKKGKIVIIGQNGIGKSMLMNILAKELDGYVYSMYEISTMIRQSYSPNSTQSELEIVNKLASVPFLGIDELGRIAMSESALNWFSYILDKRSVRNLPFYLAGNVHFRKDCEMKDGCPKCFENLFDTDILSRLRCNSTFIVIKAPDKRKEDKTSTYWEDK